VHRSRIDVNVAIQIIAVFAVLMIVLVCELTTVLMNTAGHHC
jgi:hypothetical protein